jgi:hypothetical protein
LQSLAVTGEFRQANRRALAAALAATTMGATAKTPPPRSIMRRMAPRKAARRDIFTMTNDHGLRVRFLSYGGVITETDVPGSQRWTRHTGPRECVRKVKAAPLRLQPLSNTTRHNEKS